MRSADIEIGGEYAYGRWGRLSRVKVIEKGVKTSVYNKQASGVRVEYANRGTRIEGRIVVETRDLAQWEERHDARVERDAVREEEEARIHRVADRLDVIVTRAYGGRVQLPVADFYALADRLGVDTQ